MGHIVEIAVIVVVGLAIFGPKMLQQVARNAGKGVGQANTMKNKLLIEKDKIVADMPVKELNSVAESISSIPTSPGQVIQMAVKKTLEPSKATKKAAAKTEKEQAATPTSSKEATTVSVSKEETTIVVPTKELHTPESE